MDLGFRGMPVCAGNGHNRTGFEVFAHRVAARIPCYSTVKYNVKLLEGRVMVSFGTRSNSKYLSFPRRQESSAARATAFPVSFKMDSRLGNDCARETP